MTGLVRARYTLEFKQEAVRLVPSLVSRESGDGMTMVAFKRSGVSKDKWPRLDVNPWPVLTMGDRSQLTETRKLARGPDL
jgi:hypothetical protein